MWCLSRYTHHDIIPSHTRPRLSRAQALEIVIPAVIRGTGATAWRAALLHASAFYIATVDRAVREDVDEEVLAGGPRGDDVDHGIPESHE